MVWWRMNIHLMSSKQYICCEAKMGNFLWPGGTVPVWGYRVFAYQFLVQCVYYLMVGLETSLICLCAAWLVND
jgi:hypothetical protein